MILSSSGSRHMIMNLSRVGRTYRRHGRVAVDRIGHLSTGTTPGTTKGDTHTGKHAESDTPQTLTQTRLQGSALAPSLLPSHKPGSRGPLWRPRC